MPEAIRNPATVTGHFKASSSVQIYYELLSLKARAGQSTDNSKSHRIVLIMGFAAACHAWNAIIDYLQQHQDGDLEVLTFDNRGIGKSTSPEDKKQYTTTIMARDALLLMDHVGWAKAHVAGFSMGGMISMKLAALAPARLLSLSVLSVTGGGTNIIPRRWRGFKLMARALLCAAKTPENRAYMDIKFHFSSDMLRRTVPSHGNRRMQDILLAEYVDDFNLLGMQSEAGSKGHLHAVWTHHIHKRDVQQIKSGGFPVWFIHGRHDLLAMPEFAEELAASLNAPCIMLDGGHLIVRENAPEIGAFLHSIMHPRARGTEMSMFKTLKADSG